MVNGAVVIGWLHNLFATADPAQLGVGAVVAFALSLRRPLVWHSQQNRVPTVLCVVMCFVTCSTLIGTEGMRNIATFFGINATMWIVLWYWPSTLFTLAKEKLHLARIDRQLLLRVGTMCVWLAFTGGTTAGLAFAPEPRAHLADAWVVAQVLGSVFLIAAGIWWLWEQHELWLLRRQLHNNPPTDD